MSEYEDLCGQLDAEKNKLTKLEIELHAVDSDTYFYQRKNDLNKLEELSNKKESLINEINSQKEVVNELQSQLNSFKSEDTQKQKNEFKKQQEKINQEKIEKEKKEKQEREFKKHQEKINQEKLEKKEEKRKEQKNSYKKKEKPSFKFQKKQNNGVNKTKKSFNQLWCPKCGSGNDSRNKYCLNCGYTLKKEPVEKNNDNWAVRIFLKKKNDDGSYRFSISKIIGSVYAFLRFISEVSLSFLPENIFLALIAAIVAYLICLIIGYIIRWIYNKYIK